MPVLISDNQELLIGVQKYCNSITTPNGITCISCAEVPAFLEYYGQEIREKPYYEPELCMIALTHNGITECMLADYLESDVPGSSPLIAGVIWRHFLPCMSTQNHNTNSEAVMKRRQVNTENDGCGNSKTYEDEKLSYGKSHNEHHKLYKLFSLMRNYFYETCIVPLWIPSSAHDKSSLMSACIETITLLIAWHKKNLTVLAAMANKQDTKPLQNRTRYAGKTFRRSLSQHEITALTELAGRLSHRLRFTHQMAQQFQKQVITAGFFSLSLVMQVLEQGMQDTSAIPKTKAQVKKVFTELIDRLHVLLHDDLFFRG